MVLRRVTYLPLIISKKTIDEILCDSYRRLGLVTLFIRKQEAAMKNKNTKDLKNETKSPEVKDDSYYWDMINPDTGVRWNIPMLDTLSPTYFHDYVNYMKLKERTPETFEKVLSWD